MATAMADHSVASLLQSQTQPQTSSAPTQSTHQVSPPPSGGSGESLVCQWVGCGEHANSAESLYEHVCERHVGRKSTNNLNLQCQWGSCRTTTVKRDHITSHIRVHVPLKPHKCDFCGKSFKRPQDLKKHVKTHADDSILIRSPNSSGSGGHGYHQGISKGNGYYAPDAIAAGAGNPYGYGQPAYAHSGITAHAPQGYAPINYAGVPHSNLVDGGALSESRKRGHDALEQFFSDAKRRQIDAASYVDLSARFGGLSGLQMGLASGGPFGGYSTGYDGMNPDYATAPPAMAQYQHVPQQYSMFNEIKTKNDLMSIDHFLEQLQNTVYENPGRSPMQDSLDGMHANMPHSGTPYGSEREPSLVEDTPTPASNYSTNSPASVHSSFNTGGRSSGADYPTLPGVNAITDGPSYGAPPAGLGGDYNSYPPRRHSTQHQRAAPPPKSPKEGERLSPARAIAKGEDVKMEDASSPKEESVKLAPIRSQTTEDKSEEERTTAWVENMRVIEHLRNYIQSRIERKEFDDAEASSPAPLSSQDKDAGDATPRARRSPEIKDVEMTDREKEAGSLYPVLRAVQDAE